MLSLKRRQGGIWLYPHLVLYLVESQEPRVDYLKLTPCVFYKYLFPHSDIIVISCGHFYHPWCAAIYFRYYTTCIEGMCGALEYPSVVHEFWIW